MKIRKINLRHVVSPCDAIAFLRMEIPDERHYGPLPFGHVRYAYQGVEQEAGFPMDLDKEIFLTRFNEVPVKNALGEDEPLDAAAWQDLEAAFRNAAPEILAAVHKDYAVAGKNFLLATRKLKSHKRTPRLEKRQRRTCNIT